MSELKNVGLCGFTIEQIEHGETTTAEDLQDCSLCDLRNTCPTWIGRDQGTGGVPSATGE